MTTNVTKTARAKQSPKSTSSSRVIRRAEVDKIIHDLCKRLNDQMYVAEALQKVARPNGETIVAAYPVLKVIELAAAAHAAALKEAWSIALRMRSS